MLPALILPFLAITYVLGIVMDRVSDWLLTSRKTQLRILVFGSVESYRSARLAVLREGGPGITELFEYGRSRIRIARSWAFAFALNAVTALPYSLLQLGIPTLSHRIACGLSLMLPILGLSLLTFWAWLCLVTNDYERLLEVSQLISERRAAHPQDAT